MIRLRTFDVAAVAAVALLALPTGAGTLEAQQAERHVLRGGEVAIHNLAGEMRVEGGSGSEVVIELTRGGRDADRLRIRTAREEGREVLSIIYPDDRVIYTRLGRSSNTTLQVSDNGILGGRGGRRVTVTGSGSGLEAYADLRIVIPAGRRVAMHQGVGKVWVSNVDGELRVDGASASVEAERTRGALTVDVGSGSVQLREAEGDVYVDTGSGSVDLTGVRGPRLRVDTGSGSVTASNVEVGDLNVDVGSGRVRLSGVRAQNAVVDTGSGSVELTLVAPVRSLRIDTGSGGVNLMVPRDIGAELAIDTGSGGISVDLPMRTVESRRSHLRGTLGDGSGSIRIDTGSGGVRVRGG